MTPQQRLALFHLHCIARQHIAEREVDLQRAETFARSKQLRAEIREASAALDTTQELVAHG